MTKRKIKNSSLKRRKYSITFLIIMGAGFIGTILVLAFSGILKTRTEYYSTVSNAVICILNLIVGLKVITKSLQKNNKNFFLEFFGVMIIRMIFVLIYVVVAVKLFGFPIYNFIFSFFGFYSFSLIFELNYLSRITHKEIIKGEDNI